MKIYVLIYCCAIALFGLIALVFQIKDEEREGIMISFWMLVLSVLAIIFQALTM